ncbi:hypothetical protein [Paenibacillus cremeus]|uniref:Uncharacterized protein n=1 Tax=Paenibacillus cremeus TaxID=2163881 RepID=A0A559KCJ4_9BACL|nr:hypothetical protein [Paenibacillus cremeus]TVY09852.1 hypothetical protein FPZ49_10795 [Paenibacillus cremeus]
MPTGYTHDVSEGKITDVKDYIMQCARAFGATIMMRDEPLGTPIPEFEPSTYSKNAIEKARERLKELQCMSNDEIEAQTEGEYQSELKRKKKYAQEKLETKNRYTKMLVDVYAWQAPTSDHGKLKQFCIDQLKESIKWDCDNMEGYYNPESVKKQTAQEWLNSNIERCLRDIEYHSKEWEKEVERTNERNLWVKQLRDSFN